MRRVDCMRPLRTWLLCMLVTVPVMAAESVLLLHGIARSPRHMQPLETALAQSGFEVINMRNYPSAKFGMHGPMINHKITCSNCSIAVIRVFITPEMVTRAWPLAPLIFIAAGF